MTLARANQALAGISVDQRRWVLARLVASSDAAAARAAGVHPVTVCRWPNKAQLDGIIADLLSDPMKEATALLTQGIPEAARVMLDALKSRNEQVRLRAAAELLDRVGFAPLQRHELTGVVATGAAAQLDAMLAKVYGDEYAAGKADDD